jgi:hypothetical protein
MNKAQAYRKNAADLMRLAQRASTTENKSRLMRIAEAWLDLADTILKSARRIPSRAPHSPPRDTSDQHPDDP